VPFNDDYVNILKPLSAIIAQTAKLKNERGLLMDRDGVCKIKFCHVPFEVSDHLQRAPHAIVLGNYRNNLLRI
jgi:hypothetical protein